MAQLTTQFFQTILAIEGGFQNLPADTGNYCEGQLIGTKYGMSAVAVSAWWGRCPTEEEMRNLSTNDAFNFYSWYFDRYNLYPVESQQLFELLANNTMGSPANAARVEQQVLNQFGYSVAVDGVRGNQTITAINTAWRTYGAVFYNAVRQAWVQYLQGLNRPEFIDGWMYRMNRYFPLLQSGNAKWAGAFLAVIFGVLFFKNRK